MNPTMKRSKQGVSSQDILRALQTVYNHNSDGTAERIATCTYSNGALEGVRLCHEVFLSLVASELAAQQERSEQDKGKGSTSTAMQTPGHVLSCLKRLGILPQHKLQSLLEIQQQQQKKKKVLKKSGNKSKKRKQSAVTQEMMEEQERLLAQSRQQALLARQGDGT